nr:hypothetical protein [Tanacetum cinerariifolium]
DINNLARNLDQQGAYQSLIYNEFRLANLGWGERLKDIAAYTWLRAHEGGESTQELQNLIKELSYHNAMDVEDVLTYPE